MNLVPFAIIHICVSLSLAANLLLVHRRIHKMPFLVFWAYFWVGIATTLLLSQVATPLLAQVPGASRLLTATTFVLLPSSPILMLCAGLSIGETVERPSVRKCFGIALALGLPFGIWRFFAQHSEFGNTIAASRPLLTVAALLFFVYRLATNRLATKGNRGAGSAQTALVSVCILYTVHNALLFLAQTGLHFYTNASYGSRAATIGILLQVGLTLIFSYVAVDAAEVASGEAAEAGRRLRSLLETVRMAGLIVDRKGRVEFCNQWLAEALGLPLATIIGSSWVDRCIPASEREAVRRIFETGFETGQLPAIHEYSLETTTGQVLDISWYHSLLRDTSGTIIGMASLGTDSGQQKRMDVQVQQAQKMETLGRLAGGVAHDFNNHLTVINGFADLLLDQLRHDPEAQSQLRHIRNSGEVARNLTQQLLTFSRQRTSTLREISLNEKVSESVEMLRRLIREDVTLETELSESDEHIMADPGHVDQVLLNLAINANDAIPGAGTIRIRTRRFTGARPGTSATNAEVRKFAVLEVEDTGTGMDEWTRSRIFEPFFTTKSEGKGTGLGLATVHGAVSQGGGWIDVHSQPGKGSIFSVFWPCMEAPRNLESNVTQKNRMKESGRTILLVEDQKMVREFAGLALKNKGHRVLEASNADEALQIASDLQLELNALVTDIVMPGMSGDQLARALRKQRPGLATLLVSGYEFDHDLILNDSEAPSLFLRKPYSADQLCDSVTRLVQSGHNGSDKNIVAP